MATSLSLEPGRKTERIVPTGDLVVHVQGSNLSIDLWDLSLGGFAIRCPRPFHTGMTHRFTFTARTSGRSTTLVAKAVHSRASNQDGTLTFVTGWAFMSARSHDDQAALSQLYLAATAAPEL